MHFPAALWKNRELWWRLTEREVLGRYRGSAVGVGWSVITPIAMLAVYTFVFSQVFKSRWGDLDNMGSLGFAVNLFAGLIVFNTFSECANRAPTLVLNNPNYVKKVVFPLEVLGSVAVGSSGFHTLTSLSVLLVFELFLFRSIPVTLVWLPLAWAPLFLGCLATTWILSSLGVFLRDINQVVSVAVNMLLFLSPVFFPTSALPPRWQALLGLNPMAHMIEQTRRILVEGKAPSIEYVFFGTIIGLISCEISFRFFQKSKGAFADVI